MTFGPMDRVLRIPLLLTAFLLAPFAAGAAEESIDRAVKRLDPGRSALVPVQSPIPGKIYNHYSDRMNRRVWAFVQPDGSFSHALGEGSTQNTKMFDFPYSTAQQQEMIAEIAPRWAKSMQQVGSEIFVRLNREQTWNLVQHLTIPSIYDLETGRRWEWHGDRRVAVGHTGGYRWRMEDGRYLPESNYPYGMTIEPMGCSRCGHAPCGPAGCTY
jgi:hypothetical protein